MFQSDVKPKYKQTNRKHPRTPTPSHDKLARVRPIIQNVRLDCKAQYHPHREVSVDEGIVGFSSRLRFNQYVPLNPTKRGIKVLVRVNPLNGYTNDFHVYTKILQLVSRVIWCLASKTGHVVFYGSFFTLQTLYKEPLECHISNYKQSTVDLLFFCRIVCHKSNKNGLSQNL